jgi:hypothetical protein
MATSSSAVMVGTSQLNSKLGKAKSKVDLFGDFRSRVG